MKRTIVAVGGFSSEVGKTTLLCEFLLGLWCQSSADRDIIGALPIYTHAELPQLISRVRAVHVAVAA